jgi:hypothetical protein
VWYAKNLAFDRGGRVANTGDCAMISKRAFLTNDGEVAEDEVNFAADWLFTARSASKAHASTVKAKMQQNQRVFGHFARGGEKCGLGPLGIFSV